MSSSAARLAAYLGPVIPLTQRFLVGELNGEEYELAFFRTFRELAHHPDADIYRVAERYFFAVEDHVFDERLRNPGDLTTEDLKRRAVELLRDAGQPIPTRRRDSAAS